MPVGTPFTSKSLETGSDWSWVQLPLAPGSSTVVRRSAASTIGYPQDLTASGKVVAATNNRPFAVDQFSIYTSSARGLTVGSTVHPATFGVGVTLNIPRDPAAVQATTLAVLLGLLGHNLQYLGGASWSAANVTTLQGILSLAQLPFALNGIR